MASFLEYIRQNAGTRSFDNTLKTFFLWIIFFTLVLAAYWNIINVIGAEARGELQARETVRQFSSDELRTMSLDKISGDPTQVSGTADNATLPSVVTVRIS